MNKESEQTLSKLITQLDIISDHILDVGSDLSELQDAESSLRLDKTRDNLDSARETIIAAMEAMKDRLLPIE